MVNKIIPEGFKDDVSTQVVSEHNFKNLIINHFLVNGFKLVKTPLIEFLNKDVGDNVFQIKVKKNEKKLNIRDDITLQVARLSQTRLSIEKKPLKLCYYGEVVRKKGTMLRPERQFLQIGAEFIGEESYLADVEIMELALDSLKLVGIKKITIEISSRVFFDKYINSIKQSSNKNQIKQLIKLKDFSSLLKLTETNDHKYIKNIFSCTGIYKNKKNNLKKLAIDHSTSKEVHNIENIIKVFSKRNKNINIFLDLCEIDDKKYHSGVRFTFFANNVRGEIARGGRYLVNILNDKSVATGFTCYMDSILRATSYRLKQKKLAVPFNTSKDKINALIKKGFTIVKYTGDFKISQKIAKNQDCQFFLKNNVIKKI